MRRVANIATPISEDEETDVSEEQDTPETA
jgi:hypothetical protein